MCDPVTAGLALSVVTAGAGYVSSNQQANAQQSAANRNAQMAYEQQAVQQHQVNERAALDQSERIKQGLLERAQIATISGESGALGLSSDRLINDSFMQEGTDISSLEKNRLNSETQSKYAGKQTQVNTQNSINNADASRQSLLQTGLQIGADGYNIHSTSTKRAKAKA
jgi:hypothetical protein